MFYWPLETGVLDGRIGVTLGDLGAESSASAQQLTDLFGWLENIKSISFLLYWISWQWVCRFMGS